MKHAYTLLALVCSLTYGAVANAQCSVTFTYNEDGLTIDASSVGTGTATFPGYGYDWGDGSIGVGQNASHTYAAAGTYTVCAYFFDLADTTNCSAEFCQDITVSASGASIKEVTEPVSINVYPNPAVNSIEISSNELLETFQIYNTLGSLVYSDRVMATSTKVTITDLPKGVYLLRCNGLTKRFVKK